MANNRVNRVAVILLSLFLAIPAFAENVGAFQKFSMGVMLGFGPSVLTNGDRGVYSDNVSIGFALSFRMAFPLTERTSLLADIGADGCFGFVDKSSYAYRRVVDSVSTSAFDITVMWNAFLTENFFMSVGPSLRFPKIKEYVQLDGKEVYSGEPEYANDLWLDAVLGLGYKNGAFEIGLRIGYEFLGMYKETDNYFETDINELLFRVYFTYWFGQ